MSKSSGSYHYAGGYPLSSNICICRWGWSSAFSHHLSLRKCRRCGRTMPAMS
uniref:Uncharacterized protein n=1 Tax=Ascaris lumbricoides TaxID=6252 RepID=A0A0M3HI43_ASCLU